MIGRAGSNINAIRAATGAHIEVDKQSKGQGERIITIKLVNLYIARQTQVNWLAQFGNDASHIDAKC